MRLRIPACAAALVGATLGLALGQGRPADVPFAPRLIDIGASETAAVADVNGDGRADIISGERWYEGPSWTPHAFRTLGFSSQYVDSFSDLPLDVNGDGRVDLVGVSWFARHIVWWQNPGPAGGAWREAEIDSGFPVEFARLADLDNDGQAREVLPQPGTAQTPQAWYEAVAGQWVKHVVSDKSYGHGIGAGDVNGDGRTDILTPRGWLEAPADPRQGDWTLHAAWATVNVMPAGTAAGSVRGTDSSATPPPPRTVDLGFMHVLDVNDDGRNDVIAAAGHDYGVYWFEQQADGSWVRRVIDNAWSQGHASTLADINGDGRLDFVTGKRFMAHNGGDPGGREPLGVYWYEWLRKPAGGEWVRHIIDYGGRMGGGMQIPVVDLDGDGDLDLVCAGKSGLFVVVNNSR